MSDDAKPAETALAAVPDPAAAPTLEERLQTACRAHDDLLQQERDLEVQLAAIKEQRQQAFGRVQTLRELLTETPPPPPTRPNRAARRAKPRPKR